MKIYKRIWNRFKNIGSDYWWRQTSRKLIRIIRKRVNPRQNIQPRYLFEVIKYNSNLANRILVIIAHPDDETFCSGLITLAVKQGFKVSILSMTRGEGGDRQGFNQEEIASIREAEIKASAKILGVENLWFMGYVDKVSQGSKLSVPTYSSNELINKITAKIQESGANIIVTHGSNGEYWHPAHVCLHDYVCKALRIINDSQIMLLTMNAWNPQHPLQAIINQDDYPDFHLDSTIFHNVRLKALEAYNTQRRVFEKFGGGTIENFIRLSAIERYHLVKF